MSDVEQPIIIYKRGSAGTRFGELSEHTTTSAHNELRHSYSNWKVGSVDLIMFVIIKLLALKNLHMCLE